MAKQCTGIDIGTERLKVVVCEGQSVAQVAIEDIPDNLVHDGHITSFEAMSDLLKDLVKKHKITAKNCSIALHSSDVYTRRITMPAMTVEELDLNLPYEFRDYIADDKDKYNFDYAVLRTRCDAAGQPIEMDLLAAAIPTETIGEYANMVRRAGLKLKGAAPDIMSYDALIEAYEGRMGHTRGVSGQVSPASPASQPGVVGIQSSGGFPPAGMPTQPLPPAAAEAGGRDYCFVDIGSGSTKVYLFPGGMYEVTRIVEFGTRLLISAIADSYSVDAAMAKTYLSTDYEGCQSIEPCLDLYEHLGIEVARIVSFFGFNFPDSQLDAVYVGGSGANINPLMQALHEHVNVDIRDMAAIMPPSSVPPALLRECPAAVGIALQ